MSGSCECPQPKHFRSDQWPRPHCLVTREPYGAKAQQELCGGPGMTHAEQARHHVGGHARTTCEQLKGGATGGPDSSCCRLRKLRLHVPGTSPPTTTPVAAGVPVLGVSDSVCFADSSVLAASDTCCGPRVRSIADWRSSS